MSSWSWSGRSSSSQKIKIVQTSTSSGQRTVTYKSSTSSIEDSSPFATNANFVVRTKERSAVPPASDTSKVFRQGQFEQECLDEHNRLRAAHGCPPLKLNSEMCRDATAYAQKLAAMNTLVHRSQRVYGENLFMYGGGTITGSDPVKNWYNEIKQYHFSKPGFSYGSGHFTQVVWKNSTELGVGIGQRNNSTFVVATYNPPGNVMNEYVNNVPKLLR